LVTLYSGAIISPSRMSAKFSVMHVCYILYCTVNVAQMLELTKPNLVRHRCCSISTITASTHFSVKVQ